MDMGGGGWVAFVWAHMLKADVSPTLTVNKRCNEGILMHEWQLMHHSPLTSHLHHILLSISASLCQLLHATDLDTAIASKDPVITFNHDHCVLFHLFNAQTHFPST